MWWDLKFLLNWSTMKLKMLKPRCISVYKYLLNAFISMLNTGWQPFLLSILFFIPILGDNCISLWFQSVFSQQDTFKSNLKFFPTIHFIWVLLGWVCSKYFMFVFSCGRWKRVCRHEAVTTIVSSQRWHLLISHSPFPIRQRTRE